jgi:hypothetical protein
MENKMSTLPPVPPGTSVPEQSHERIVFIERPAAAKSANGMKNLTKALVGASGLLAYLLTVPEVHQAVVSFISQHENITALVGAVTTVSALLHNPKG